MSGFDDHGTSATDANEAERRLAEWLADAPRLAASAAFEQRVMRALQTARVRRPWTAQLREFLFSPRTLRWNVASVAAAAAVVLALGLGWALHGSLSRTGGSATVSVRFALYRPDAREVRLAGDFTAWQARVPLVRQPDGSWLAEVKLPPGEYEYAFVVDGRQWTGDPTATRFRDDGLGGRNALLTVPLARKAGYEG